MLTKVWIIACLLRLHCEVIVEIIVYEAEKMVLVKMKAIPVIWVMGLLVCWTRPANQRGLYTFCLI